MKKKLIIGIISVLLILTGVGYGVGSFFVHYALSPVSDSAKRNINEEDKIDTAKGTEKVILQNQKKEQIQKHKCSSSIHSCDIRESPYISQTNCTACGH